MKRSLGLIAGALGVLALEACGGVESPSVDDRSVPEWTAELDLRIGAVDDPDYALTAVRWLEVGPDGSIYTLHSSERLIRQFDEDGTLVRTFGGQGGGPGEFQSPRTMGLVADTLWVMDGNGYRISQFALDGRYLGGFSVPFRTGEANQVPAPPRAVGLLTNGTVWGEPPGFSDAIADGRLTERSRMLMRRDGTVTDTLLSIPYGHFIWDISLPGGRGGSYGVQPFADSPIVTFALTEPALIVLEREAPTFAEDAKYRVSEIGFDGDSLFSRELAFDPIPATRAEVDSLLDGFAHESAEYFSLTEARARELAEATLFVPAFRPGASALVPGRDGTIWIQEEPGDADVADWVVLDVDGEPLGRVTLPAGLRVFQAELGQVWGVETDALDVPYVVRYRVTSPMIAIHGSRDGATLAAVGAVTEHIAQRIRHEGSSHDLHEADS